jgi:hypothetical protein
MRGRAGQVLLSDSQASADKRACASEDDGSGADQFSIDDDRLEAGQVRPRGREEIPARAAEVNRACVVEPFIQKSTASQREEVKV